MHTTKSMWVNRNNFVIAKFCSLQNVQNEWWKKNRESKFYYPDKLSNAVLRCTGISVTFSLWKHRKKVSTSHKWRSSNLSQKKANTGSFRMSCLIVNLWNKQTVLRQAAWPSHSVNKYKVFHFYSYLEEMLQWATRVVETLLENDTFQHWSTCSVLFVSSVHSLIQLAPNSMLCRCCDLHCLKNRKINIVLGERGEIFSKTQKIEFHSQVSQHCCCSLLSV